MRFRVGRERVYALPVAKHVGLSKALQVCVLLEQQVEAPGPLVAALEDRAVLQGLWVTAPAVKDVMVVPCHGLRNTPELVFGILKFRSCNHGLQIRSWSAKPLLAASLRCPKVTHMCFPSDSHVSLGKHM